MFTHFSHNQFSLTFKAARLINFADQPEAPKKLRKKKAPIVPANPSSPANSAALQKDQELHKPLTGNQENRVRKLGLSPEQFKGHTRLDSRIIDQLYKSEILRDGLYTKDPSNPYYLLMKALADGKLPGGGASAPRLLKAIEGGKSEKAQVIEILKEVYLHSGPLTPKATDKYIAELDEAKSKDVVQEARKEAEDTLAKVETVAERDYTKSRIGAVAGKALDKPEAAEATEKAFMKIGNWEVEAPREGLMKELSDLSTRYKKLNSRYFKAYKECERAADELQSPMLDPSKKEALITKIHNLEQEKATIEMEMKKLRAEAERAKEEYELWVKKTMKMFDKFQIVLSEAGVDVLMATRLKRWLFNQTALASNDSSSLEIGGVQSSKETGLSSKIYGEMTIRKVFFSPLELSPNIPKEGEIKEAIGQLMIEFEDEKGEVSTTSYFNFISMVDSEEVHEQIADMDELNYQVAKEAHYKPLAVGDQFEAKFIEGFDNKGEEINGTRTISIAEIKNQNGQPVIVLDHSVTKTPKEKLAFTVAPALYFDREQTEFPAGEFSKFVKQYEFKRVQTPEDTPQRILDGAAQYQKERLRRLNLPSDEVGSVMLPKTGEAPREVTVYSDMGKPMKGRIIYKGTKPDGSPDYDIETEVPNPETDLEVLNAKAISDFEGIPIPPEIKEPSFRIEQQALPAASFLAMADKGNISPAQSATPSAKVATPEMEEEEDFVPTSSAQEPVFDEKAAKEKAARSIKPEALPYKDIYKEGRATVEQRGVLKLMWDDMRILSCSDLWAMGKSMYDYYQRRWDRKQKDKYSTVGTELPYFGTEMRRIQQSAENEEVGQFKDSFAQKGIFEIQERLHNTKNKDEFKACIIDLAGKGQMRWDSVDFWKNLNYFISDPKKLVPIPSSGDPATIVGPEGRTGFDYLQGAIDSLWGESTYDGWVSQDKSTRQSGARGWYEKGKEVEITPGGHQKVLENLLRKHRNGEYVDPQQFEGLILHMIEAGKADIQDKLYYIVAGAAAENSDGRTILSFDRVAHINSEMLARFPILEYMTAAPLRPDGKRHKWTKDDYKRFLNYFEKGVGQNYCKPTKEVDHFLWRYIIPSYENETRVNKDLRNADNLDHDDMFAYLPPASSKILENACRTVGGGGKHLLTIEGYANAAPGFSKYFKSLAHFRNPKRLIQAIQSYARFEAIMMDKWEKGNKDFARMDNNILTKKPVASETPPIVFFNELNGMMKKIAQAYGDSELLEAVDLIQTDTSHWDIAGNPSQKAQQNRIQQTLVNFDSLIEKVISQDNAEKAIKVVNSCNLEGMDYEGSLKDYSDEIGLPGAELENML